MGITPPWATRPDIHEGYPSLHRRSNPTDQQREHIWEAVRYVRYVRYVIVGAIGWPPSEATRRVPQFQGTALGFAAPAVSAAPREHVEDHPAALERPYPSRIIECGRWHAMPGSSVPRDNRSRLNPTSTRLESRHESNGTPRTSTRKRREGHCPSRRCVPPGGRGYELRGIPRSLEPAVPGCLVGGDPLIHMTFDVRLRVLAGIHLVILSGDVR